MCKIFLAIWVTFLTTFAIAEVGRPLACVTGKIVSVQLPFTVVLILCVTIALTFFACKEGE